MVKEKDLLLENARKVLKQKQERVDKLMAEKEKLQNNLDAKIDEGQKQEDLFEQTNNRLENVDSLTSCLSDEYTRWDANCKALIEQIKNLIEDVFVSACCIS